MGKQKPIEIIHPPNTLKIKVGGGLKGIGMDAIKRAEEALAGMKDEMQNWLKDELEVLHAAQVAFFADKQSAEKRQSLFTCAHDLKGLGTTYDYPLVTRVAGSLCQLMLGVGEDGVIPSALAEAHLNAIRVIVRDSVQNPEDPMGVTLAGELERQVASYLAPEA